MKISFIQPSRNNLRYLRWSYDSIRKNQGRHTVQICVADDFSDDGTWEWCQEMMEKDANFNAIRNEGPTRLGHTILYDRLVNEVAQHDLCMIYHADMYLMPGALDAIEKYMYAPNPAPADTDTGKQMRNVPISKTIVSLTRIEPPLHPPGPEKIIKDFGTEPEEFKENELLDWYNNTGFNEYYIYDKFGDEQPITEGIFAPWAFWKSDFQEIGGHDPLYAPQSKEDSDIFNRFQLNGVKFIQTWEGYVYHMTCRGSRFNPTLTEVGKESDEWLAQNKRSTRNFLRKWGHMVMHDEYMKPIIPSKYNIELRLFNGTEQLLYELEPLFDYITIDLPLSVVDEYKAKEQPNTMFDLNKRINPPAVSDADIVISTDGRKFTQNTIQIIYNLSQILDNSDLETGNFEIDILSLDVRRIKTYENNLIVCK